MAVDAASARSEHELRLGFARVASIPARWAVAGIVAVSFVVRYLSTLAHSSPVFFPDEYIYSSIAHGLATTGRPTIRGEAAHFPALLEPILAAPFWLTGDPLLAYRLTQAENTLVMSLAAVPMYLLARRLGLGAGLGVLCAAAAVLPANLYYSAFVIAGPIAYTLALTAVYAGVRALERPTARAQLAFLALAALTAFAHVQFAVLPLAFVVAAAVTRRGRVGAYRLTLALLALGVAAGAAVGARRLLGYYSAVAHLDWSPGPLLHWLAVDGMLFAYAAGFVLVPGALAGIAYGVLRSRSPVERGFAALTAALAGCLFGEAALYAANGSARFQGRYLAVLLPLVAPAFCLWAARGFAGRRAVALGALGLFVISATVPLSGYTQGDGKQDSHFLWAVFAAEKALGSAGAGALAVSLAAGALALFALAVAVRRRGVVLALALTLAAGAAGSVGAHEVETRNAQDFRADALPADVRWVDRERLDEVALLRTPGGPDGRALAQLFWNKSVGTVLLLPGATPTDVFGAERVAIAPDGTLVHGGRPVRRPLLVETFAGRVSLSGAELAARGPGFDLWRPAGTPRVTLYALGLYRDGWLARGGEITAWPDASGRVSGELRFTVSLPRETRTTVLRFRGPGVDRRVTVRPGERVPLVFRADRRGPWTLTFRTNQRGGLWDGRSISVQATAPVFARSSGVVCGAEQPVV